MHTMRRVTCTKAGPGQLSGVYQGRTKALPEVGEPVVVHSLFDDVQFEGVVSGVNKELWTFDVVVCPPPDDAGTL